MSEWIARFQAVLTLLLALALLAFMGWMVAEKIISGETFVATWSPLLGAAFAWFKKSDNGG